MLTDGPTQVGRELSVYTKFCTPSVYAAYGGVYIGAAIVWLWAVDGVRPSAWDVAGVAVALLGMALIAFQPR